MEAVFNDLLHVKEKGFVIWGNRTLRDAVHCLEGYQRLIAKRQKSGIEMYIQPDADLGWTNLAAAEHPRWGYRTNSLGNRRTSDEDTILFDASRRHVALVGNSYVHGDEVADEETWGWKLQSKLHDSHAIHNLGVTAYSTDQSVLRFLKFSRERHIDASILALTTTDLYRNLNLCRAFIYNDLEVPLFKPRFLFSKSKVSVINPLEYRVDELVNALSRAENIKHLKRYDSFYPGIKNQSFQIMRRFRAPLPSEWHRLFKQAVEQMWSIVKVFVENCLKNNIKPIILVLPVFWGAFPAGKEFDILKDRCMNFVDVIDAREIFSKQRLELPPEQIHHRYNHYTSLSNEWLSCLIAEDLDKHGRLDIVLKRST